MRARHRPGASRRDERGFILVAVVIALAAITLLVRNYLTVSNASVAYRSVVVNAGVAEINAQSGVELAYVELFAGLSEGADAFQGEWRRCEIQGVSARYAIQDMSGLLDLNTAQPALVTALLEARFGQPGRALAEGVLARRKAAQQANEIAFSSLRDLLWLAEFRALPVTEYASELTTSSGALGVAPEAASAKTRRALQSLSLPRALTPRASRRRFRIMAIGSSGSARAMEVVVVRLAPGTDRPFLVEQRYSSELFVNGFDAALHAERRCSLS